MNDEVVNRSAILELATYAMCTGKDLVEFEEDSALNDMLVLLKDKLSLEKMTDDIEQSLRYIEQVELAMKSDPSIGDVKMLRTSFGDYSSPMDAVCFDDGGDVYVQYRGTPKSGWVENAISYGAEIGECMAADGISSQIQADGLAFFESCVSDFVLYGGAEGLIVGGHSQGGNVAEYVTMMSEYGEVIDACVSLDGPDHSRELEGYIKEKSGLDYFNAQAAKITSINGNNDYVNMQGQVSFAGREYYIETNDAWAEENGQGGAWGYHDILYMMDREYGGLIPTKEQVDAKMQAEEFWGKLPLGEYAGFLAYVTVEEQLEFLSLLPAAQQAQVFAQLPVEQQMALASQFPVWQKVPLFEYITDKQQDQMKIDSANWQDEQKKANQPQWIAAPNEDDMKKNEQATTAREQAERERERQAKADMARAKQDIQEIQDNLFWEKLPYDEYAEFLICLTPEEQMVFLEMFPPKYRKQILEQLMPYSRFQPLKYREMFETDPSPSLLLEASKKREWAIAARDEALEDLRIRQQAEEVRRSQTGKQGAFGQLMVKVIEYLIPLPEYRQYASVKTAMGLFELILGSKKTEDLIKMGLTQREMEDFFEYGLPAILEVIKNNDELAKAALIALLPEGVIKDIATFLNGLPPQPTDLLMDLLPNGVIKDIVAALSIVFPGLPNSNTLRNILNIFEVGVKVLGPIEVGTASVVVRAGAAVGISSSLADLFNAPGQAKPGAEAMQYAADNPEVRVDTDKLRGYALRVQGIISRFNARLSEVNAAARREWAKDEEDRDEGLITQCQNMMEAFEDRIEELTALEAYFTGVADDFEAAEANILAHIANLEL